MREFFKKVKLRVKRALHTLRHPVDRMRLRRRLKEFDSSYRFVFMPQGLGDILFFCMYAKEYRKIYPECKLAFIVTKRHLKELVEVFSDCFDTIFELDTRHFEVNDVSRFHYLYPAIYDDRCPQPDLQTAIKGAMQLAPCTPPYIPALPRTEETEKKLRTAGLVAGRSVLIAPDAVSCSKLISDEAWLDIATGLEQRGYKVFFNVGDTSRFPNFKKVFLSVLDTVHFVSDAGYFLSYRSGLCDVVATFSDASEIVIYPNDKKTGEFPSILNFDRNPNQRYMEYCSLKNWYPDKDIVEFIYDKDSVHKKLEEALAEWPKY
jgi:hypothetical protein